MTTSHEKSFDFTKPLDIIIQQANKRSYKKLAFLSIGFGVSLAFGFLIGKDLISTVENKVSQYYHEKELIDTNTINEIKTLKPEEFSQVVSHLKKNMSIYNEMVFLIVDRLTKWEYAPNSGSTSSASAAGTSLNELLTIHKKIIEEQINSISSTYQKIQMGATHISKDEQQIFITALSQYKNNVYSRNTKLENAIQSWLYNSERSNKDDFMKNGIYDKVKALDFAIDNNTEITSTNSQISTKPKI